MELIINDVKLEGDLMDADFMEKFEQSMIKMRDTAQAKKRENFPTAAANYRAQCEVVNVCFDEIFGARDGRQALPRQDERHGAPEGHREGQRVGRQ